MNLNLSWMAWTWPTAIFFIVVALLLVGMGAWEYVSPGGNPRIGILRFETTRGDRLFVTLLGAADHKPVAMVSSAFAMLG